MRLFLLSILIFALIFAGLILLDGRFLILAIPLLTYLAGGVLFQPASVKLTVSRRIQPTQVQQGEPVLISLELRNEGGNLQGAVLVDDVPGSFNYEEGYPNHITDIPSGAESKFSYKLSANRGIYKIQGIRVLTGDPFGLFISRKFIEYKNEFVVLPRVPHIRRFIIRTDTTKIYTGIIPSRVGGSGIDFFGVREFFQGDTLRQINWKKSASFVESLFSNEFEQERTADIWLILDARTRSNFLIGKKSLFEYQVEITSSVSQHLLRSGNRVGLLIYGGYLDWTYLGSGKRQREKILRALAGAKPGESLIFDELEYIPTRIFPPRSHIVLISPIQIEDFQFLASIRARGYQVLCISPDTIPIEREDLERSKEGKLGVRLAQVERKTLLSRLIQCGIIVLDIDASQPVENTLYGLYKYTRLGSRLLSIRNV